MKKQDGYSHNVSKCITKIVKDARKNDSTIEWIDFELSTIQMFGVKPTKFKTGQPIKIYRKTKSGNEKATKIFVTHSFCPFCGAKF
jgi:hypothetical protein